MVTLNKISKKKLSSLVPLCHPSTSAPSFVHAKLHLSRDAINMKNFSVFEVVVFDLLIYLISLTVPSQHRA